MSIPFSHITLAILWIIYCLLHSILATDRFKSFAQQRMKKNFRFYRLYYNLFAKISLIAIVFYQTTLKSSLQFKPDFISVSGGILIGITGLLIMIICIAKYFKGLSGLFALPEKKNEGVLIISGIHQWVRHPLYLGTFLLIWGGWIAYPLLSLFISNCIITIYTLIGIRLEEKKLIAEYGELYKTYQQNVPMIIPGGRKNIRSKEVEK
jgi:protein-S-isoprenylcysteine O-methyltransferase Ste14